MLLKAQKIIFTNKNPIGFLKLVLILYTSQSKE